MVVQAYANVFGDAAWHMEMIKKLKAYHKNMNYLGSTIITINKKEIQWQRNKDTTQEKMNN